MTSIDPSTRIASMVRAALAAQKEKSGKRPAAAGKAPPPASRGKPSDLGALIAGRVAAIPVDDPDRKRKVFRAFLEATLLAELGEHLQADPLFGNMVDAVQEQMTADPQIAAAVEQAVQVLLSPPASGG